MEGVTLSHTPGKVIVVHNVVKELLNQIPL